jgi:hypothetical protein
MERIGRADATRRRRTASSPTWPARPTTAGGFVDVWESEEAAGASYGSERFQSMLEGAPPIDQQPWRLRRVEIDHMMRDLAAR